MDRFDLITKLAAVEALEGGGATWGERHAASRARARLEARLVEAPEPLPGSFAEEMAAGHHLQSPPDHPPVRVRRPDLPSRDEVAARIEAWRSRGASHHMVARWAADLVDGMVLPDHSVDDPASVVPEVLLVLASTPADLRVAELAIRFLESPASETAAAWTRWLDGLAAIT